MEGAYAGFWKRFVAAAIDFVVLMAVSVLLGWITVALNGAVTGSVTERPGDGIGYVTSILVWWIYYASFESSAWQATLGKRALGIKVVDLQGGRVSFARATGRHFSKFVSGLILMIGYLMAGFTGRKQALHDLMAGCLVVNRDVTAAPAAPARRRPGWQTALIVLGICVLPVAVVMAVFVPVYQDRLLRARVMPVIATGVQATRKVEEFYLRNKAMPRDLKEAGVTDIAGSDIRMVPKVRDGSRVEWSCGSDIHDKYLPAACRK
jgi:uncharacterized RDD family membrane protein YckC